MQAVIGVRDDAATLVAKDVDVVDGNLKVGRPLGCGEHDVGGDGTVGPAHGVDGIL